MKTKIIALLGAGLSLLITFGTPHKASAQSEAPILFNSCIPGTPSQVYAINPDGTGLIRLTNGETDSTKPSWHPSYQYISFFRDGNLCVMEALPEGKRVEPTVVGPAFDIGADFSPDGKSMVYVGPRPTDGGGLAILIRPVDVSKKRVKVGAATMVWQRDAYGPSFSPDGTKVVFSSQYIGTFPTTGQHIKVLDLDTGAVAALDSVSGFMPTWSADGEQIAFCGRTGEVNPETGNWISEVFIMNADSSRLTQVTDLGNSVCWPSFSPEGDGLVFGSGYNGTPALYQLSLISGEVTLFLPEADAAHWTP